MSGLTTITIAGKSGGTGAAVTLETRPLLPELADAMRAQGLDPAEVNTVRWPVYGASRWATATFLMTRAAVDADTTGLKAIATDGDVASGPLLYVTLNYGAQIFKQMVIGQCIPVIAGINDSLYLVRLHCRRWLWRHVKARPPYAFEALDTSRGYNIAGISRGRYRRRTLNADAKWTFQQIVDRLLAGDAANGFPALQVSNDNVLAALGSASAITSTLLTDMSGDDTAPGLIDRTLAKAGQVLSFVPSVTANKTYDIRVEEILTGEARAATFLNSNKDAIIGGGVEGFVSATLTGTGAHIFQLGNSGSMARDCPKEVRVYFPFAMTDQSDEVLAESHDVADPPFSSTGTGSIIDGKFVSVPAWDSDEDRPFATDTKMPTKYHIRCDAPIETFSRDVSSVADVVEDGSGVTGTSLADVVASIYYSRFSAGACDVWFRDVLALTSSAIWAGGQWWDYQLRTDGEGFEFPVTHVHGERDCDLFGYAPMHSPEQVLGFGTVSVHTGADGAIRVIGHHVGPIPCVIRIKGATPIADTFYRWEYDSRLLQRDDGDVGNLGWIEGQTIVGINTVERNNTAVFAGPSYKLPLASAPGFLPLAIGTDRDNDHTDIDVDAFLVEDRKYAAGRVAYFSLSNGIDGIC